MRPLIVDSFAGGGGASTGIEMALGRSPDIAINHNAAALAMHEANHPETMHLSKNIWQVDPLEAVGTHLGKGRPVGLAWFSPDCKHFSKAKGGKPVKRNVRDLAWTVVLWAKRVRPAVIILENVEEFQSWGPLTENARGEFVPDPERRGETFKRWIADLKRCGYKVEWRELVAADYGAPTTRKRLFIIARRDGQKIIWPTPTHFPPASRADGPPAGGRTVDGRRSTARPAAGRTDYSQATMPWRTAAEIIDWSLPCPSIFETREEIMAKHGVVAKRPLAEATMARVARGTKRYVLDAAEPFIVKFQTGSTGSPIDTPLPTVTANSYQKRPGGAAPVGLVVPSIVAIANGDGAGGTRREHCVTEPIRTQHAGGNKFAIIAPVLTAAQHGGSNRGADEQMRTVAASDKDQHAIIAPSLMPLTHQGADRNHSVEEPLRTVTTAHCGEIALVAPTLIQTGYGERVGQAPRSLDIGKPLGTVVAGGAKQALVAAFVAQHNNDSRRIGGVNPGREADRPLSTVTATVSQQGVVAAHLTHAYTSNTRGGRGDLEAPLKTVVTGNHAACVAAFMTKYYGEGGMDQAMTDPLHTVTSKARMGFVTVELSGEPYVITDIGLRMLTPRELFLAQGFPPSYRIDDITCQGRTLTKSEKIACVGNSVCPPLAAALVSANCADLMASGFAPASGATLEGGADDRAMEAAE